MRKIGVTGAAGFVGSHVCELLLDAGCDLVGVDDLSYGSVANVAPFLENPRFQLEVFDCAHQRELRRAFVGCDAIIHLAAKKIPRFGGTYSTLHINTKGMEAACAVALSLDAQLVFSSTSDVYGDGEPPYAEDGQLVIGPPTTKRWAYAVSKMYDEHYGLALADERGLQVTILRLFNAYGPRNHLSWWGGPVVTFVESLLDGEPMEIHGDGLQTRTFTHVRDIAEGIIASLDRPDALGEVINLGGTETVTILELAELIQAEMDAPLPLRTRMVPYETLPGRYQDVRHRVPHTSKAKRLLGFEPKITLAEGLRETVAWHREIRADDTSLRASG
jgi:UDP-glucose 4-epimerase